VTRVCFVSDAPFLGGAERYIGHIALGLDPSSFHASLVLRSGNDEALDSWSAELAHCGVDVRRAPMRVPFRPLDANGIYSALQDLCPDIVHVNMPGPYDGQMALAAPIARMAGARAVVTTEHLPMVERLWKRAFVKRFAYRYVDRVLTVCQANVPYLVKRQSVAPKKIRVVPNALAADYGTATPGREELRREYSVPHESVVVAFLGNLLEHKGLYHVVEALREVPDKPWHLLVIGTGPEETRCRTLLEKSGLSERATFTGARDPSEVQSLLAGADLLTLPSRIEGMPYVILEAMASSLPVVATSVFGIPEMVADNETGLLVAPDDVGQLRDSLTRLIDDAGMRARFGAAARKRFEELFTIDHQIRSVEAIYRELVHP